MSYKKVHDRATCFEQNGKAALFSEKKLLYEVIEEYLESSELPLSQLYVIDNFYKYVRFRDDKAELKSLDNECLSRYLILYTGRRFGYADASAAFEDMKKYLKHSFDFSGFDLSVFDELRRAATAKEEIARAIFYPVISRFPLVVDMESYRRHRIRKESMRLNQMDVGYFEICDMLSGNFVIIKKVSGGKYYRLILAKAYLSHVRQKDVLSLIIRQRPFSGWEIDELKAYYPAGSAKYLS